ncbi:hypothetical protein Tco_1118117 [Tanacetum coccineum]
MNTCCWRNKFAKEIFKVRQHKHVSTTPPPLSDDQEQDDIHEATLPSLALNKTSKIAEEQENVVAVKEKLLEEDVEKILEGEDDDSDATDFDDSIFLNDE